MSSAQEKFVASDADADGSTLGMRDPEYIRQFLPLMDLIYRHYHRVEVTGFENLPTKGPAIIISNHGGGIATPDTAMTAHAYFMKHGVDLPVYALIEPIMFSIPAVGRHLVRWGGLRATARVAMSVLESDSVLFLYPGGGDDVYRPFSERNKVCLAGKTAFVRLALKYDVPIYPIVALGGHESLVVLNDGKRLAERLGLDKLGIDRVPISLTFPFGITIGTPYNIPTPVKIELCAGMPITFDNIGASAARSREAVDACYRVVVNTMQKTLNDMVARRDARRMRRKPGTADFVRS